MTQFIFGLALIAFAAVLGFYGTQLAREGWTIMKAPKTSYDSPSEKTHVPTPAAPQNSQEPKEKKNEMSSQNPPTPSNNIGANSVVSINQQGGITAGTVNLHSSPKQWGIGPEDLAKLTARMSAFASPRERGDLLTSVMGDAESLRFGTSLVNAFRKAGWNLPGSGLNQSMFTAPVEGVVLQIRSANSKPAGLDALVVSLREAGIEPTGELVPTLPESDFKVIIGSRPR